MRVFQGAALAALLSLVATIGIARQTQAATLTGAVLDIAGKPVENVEIAAHDSTGAMIAHATTNAKGEYVMENLPPGQYNLALNPLHTGFQGQTVVATIGEKGLTVSWTVSSTAPAIAAAAPGVAAPGGVFGLGTTGTFLGGLGLAGAGVGGGVAASNSGGSGGGAPVSPAQ